MGKADRKLTQNHRERIRVTDASIEERLNRCQERRAPSIKVLEMSVPRQKSRFKVRKVFVSCSIFFLLYAMSHSNHHWMLQISGWVQSVYEHETDIMKVSETFAAFGRNAFGGYFDILN